MKKIKEKLDDNGRIFLEGQDGKRIDRSQIMPGDVREAVNGRLFEVVSKRILLPVGLSMVVVGDKRYRKEECFIVCGELGEADIDA